MPGARWFPGAHLNWAEHCAAPGRRARRRTTVVVARSQTRERTTLTADELRDAGRSRCGPGCERLGVGRGDRVAALRCRTSPRRSSRCSPRPAWARSGPRCAPEFGVRSVVDRFSQIEPKVLLAVDGYRYGDRDGRPRAPRWPPSGRRCPSLAATVLLPYLATRCVHASPDAMHLGRAGRRARAACASSRCRSTTRSTSSTRSGTTGLPKPIVHGHGGILLEHLKIHALHHDLGPADRFFWFTHHRLDDVELPRLRARWSARAIVLFDGVAGPSRPRGALGAGRRGGRHLLRHIGAVPDGLPQGRACAPGELADLSRAARDRLDRRAAAGRGVPLGATRRSAHRSISSRSPAAPTCAPRSSAPSPLRAGLGGRDQLPPPRLRGRGVRRRTGRPLVGEQGELVITAPMPSMPVGFWNDPDGSRYRDGVLRRLPRRVAPRRLDHLHRARLVRDHRPLRRHAQPRRRAARHGRVLRGRRGPARDRRLPRRPPRRRRPAAAVRRPA